MKRYLHSFLAAAALAAATVSAGTSAFAAGYDDHDALQGAKEVKVAFDITAGGTKELLGRRHNNEEKPPPLIQQGGRPQFNPLLRRPAAKILPADYSQNNARGPAKPQQYEAN